MGKVRCKGICYEIVIVVCVLYLHILYQTFVLNAIVFCENFNDRLI